MKLSSILKEEVKPLKVFQYQDFKLNELALNVDDTNNDEETEKPKALNVDDGTTLGVSVGETATSLFGYAGMTLIGAKVLKMIGGKILSKSIVVQGVKAALANQVATAAGTTAVKGAVATTTTATKIGLFKSFFSTLGFQKSIAIGAKPTLLGKLGYGLGASVKAIASFLASSAGLAVAAVGVAVWAFFYLRGDPTMYEILELWNDGRHNKKPKNDKVKKTYELAAGGFFAAKTQGLSIASVLNSKTENKGMFTIRIKDENFPDSLIEEYFSIEKIYEKLSNNPLLTEIFYGETNNEWIDKIHSNYAGLSISGKTRIDDYNSLKSYVSKYMLENSDDSKNPYKMSLAEESEGWYDTAFGLNVPGMNELGWASWMCSEEYLNNSNSVVSLQSRTWLYEILNSYWLYKVSDLNASAFNRNDFIKIVERFVGKGTPLSNPELLASLEYGILTEDAQFYSKGNFVDLLPLIGSSISKNLKAIAASDKKVPISNVTLAFAMTYATYSLALIIWEGAVTFLALSQLILELSKEQKDVLKKGNVDDEFDSKEVKDQKDKSELRSGEKGYEEQEKRKREATYKDVSDEVHEKNADLVITKFKEIPELEGFAG